MAQQTAVEKLESTIQSMIEHGADLGEDYPALMVHIQQAKEMEKQQIESAWKRGDGEHDKVADKLAKQYYTETYGK
jgi:transcriptional/translational regulatory protein YebC/TACO1